MSGWLITGAGGMLGRDLCAVGSERGVEVRGFARAELDIADPPAVRAAVDAVRPTAIVNCAAFTKVDDCEAQPELARRINGEAVGVLAAEANRVGAVLVQISTDYVFDGRGLQPYREDAAVAPMSEYGRSKLAGEIAAATARDHLIIRTSWLYGRSGWNFIEALRKQVASGKTELKVVDDQTGTPTATADLAEAIAALVEANARGIVNFANDGAVTWFGYAREIAKRSGWTVAVWPLSSEMLSRPAKRPAYSVLDTARYRELTGRNPRHWTEPLGEYLASHPA